VSCHFSDAPKQHFNFAQIINRGPLQWARDLAKEVMADLPVDSAPVTQPSNSDNVIVRYLYDPSPDPARRNIHHDRTGANDLPVVLPVGRSAEGGRDHPRRSATRVASALFEGPPPSDMEVDLHSDAEKRRPNRL
jgi:hypothetical protein